MSVKKAKSTTATRRGFLLGAGLAGAAGAAAVATRGKVAQGPAEDPKPLADARGGGGYHVTDHVRAYYRSTLL